jgi:hypothetical protein
MRLRWELSIRPETMGNCCVMAAGSSNCPGRFWMVWMQARRGAFVFGTDGVPPIFGTVDSPAGVVLAWPGPGLVQSMRVCFEEEPFSAPERNTHTGDRNLSNTWIVPLLSVGACPQQDSPCTVLGFCKETVFSGTFPPVYSDCSRFSEEQPSRGRLPGIAGVL